MKEYFYLLLTLLFSANNSTAFGQFVEADVTTPTGVSVDALRFDEDNYDDYDATDIAYWNWWWTYGYNCRILANSTLYYNCHGYAWHNIEGRMGQSNLRWINDVDQNGNPIYNVTKYYTGVNKSYTETTTVTNHQRISYFPRDHSAVTTEDQDSVISKWADGPLVKHTIPQCPFFSGSQIKYYRLNPSIDGSSASLCINSERTFTSNTSITGSTYVWSKDNNHLDYVSGAGTTSYRVKGVLSSGNAWLKLQITTPSGEIATTSNKTVWVGVPDIPVTYPTGDPPYEMMLDDMGYIQVQSAPGASSTNYDWDVSGSIEQLNSNPAQTCAIFATSLGEGYFSVTSENECGSSPVASGEVYVSLWKLLITPNPSSSEINIKLVKNDDSNLKEGNRWELEIFDQSLVTKVKATNIFDQDYKINIQNWKDGMYYVVARYGKNTITGKLVVRNKY